MAKQRRHRGIAAQGGAVDLDERAIDLMATTFELVDLPRQE
jgi:hypothetical protein